MFLPLRITSDVVSPRSFIDLFVAVFFAPNKDDDSFATILMFLGSTLLSKMRGTNWWILNYKVGKLVRLVAAGNTWPVRFTSRRALPSSADAFEFRLSSGRKLNKEPWLDVPLLWPAAWELRSYIPSFLGTSLSFFWPTMPYIMTSSNGTPWNH